MGRYAGTAEDGHPDVKLVKIAGYLVGILLGLAFVVIAWGLSIPVLGVLWIVERVLSRKLARLERTNERLRRLRDMGYRRN